ncbi:MAG: hypothetical protein DYH07_05870 [Armatimonadetes bacterium ATM1]|nr:hypothetical protein [Armatimonadota bacterium]MCE7899600.1 hypothetical protein [Armatimonadetes bacterium ATM1]RIJ96388.1 MAG: hypothetical protein DCC45_06925 [Armatimonadota bacterium]
MRAILEGKKRFEFRKVKFQRDVRIIVVYATAPISAIVAVIEIANLHEDTPPNIWKKCASAGAIRADWFFDYFGACDIAVAIELARVAPLSQPVPLRDVLPGATAPRSFRYLSGQSAQWARSALEAHAIG